MSAGMLSVAALAALVLAWLGASPPPAAAQGVKTITQSDCASGCTIPAGEVWQFPPSSSLALKSSGNIVVRGTLRMKPAKGSIKHTLTFTGVKEGNFKGGGATVVGSDVGLWVMGSGKLDIAGTPKVAWSTKWESGWKAKDVIKAAPNKKGQYTGWTEVDKASGVPKANALGHKTELLNLSRNVVIKGTAAGKTHIFIHSSAKQSVKYALLRYMAPDFLNNDDKTGRYALHFHLNANGSRGSLIEGVVVRDADGHAFVPHGSHGVTFQDTIAFNTTGEAYWWDESTGDTCPNDDDCNATDDTNYFCAVAAKTSTHASSKHTGAAFQLGAGKNNEVRDSVAVGMDGAGQNNSGYTWPSKDHGVWTFKNNVAHNNDANGVFVWQNTGGDSDANHVIDGFDAYYNKKAGIDHGAYHNSYQFEDLDLRGNGNAIESHALGISSSDGADPSQQWNRIQAPGMDLAIQLHNVFNTKAKPVRFLNCDFGDIVFDEIGAKGGGERGLYDFVDCGVKPSDMDIDNADPGTIIRIQRLDGKAWRMTGSGSVTSIAPFATAGGFRFDEMTSSGLFGRKIRSGGGYVPGWDEIASPDVDGDGDDELVFYDAYNGAARIYELLPNGKLGPLIRKAHWGKNWSSVLTPDLDGDGDDELMLYRKNSGKVRYFELTSSGLRGKKVREATYKKGWTQVATPDVDGDGDDELLLYRAGTGHFKLYELTAKATYGKKIRTGNYGKGWASIGTPDVDGDGDDEIVRYRRTTGRYTINELTSAGKLGSKKRSFITTSGWDSITSPDLDGDGDDELIRYR